MKWTQRIALLVCSTTILYLFGRQRAQMSPRISPEIALSTVIPGKSVPAPFVFKIPAQTPQFKTDADRVAYEELVEALEHDEDPNHATRTGRILLDEAAQVDRSDFV